MKRVLYIINIIISILVFASCKDENDDMPSAKDECYTILVSVPNSADTRAYYQENADSIAVVWEKGDVIKVGDADFVFKGMDEVDNTIGLFYHYGKIDNAEKWTGTITFNSDSDNQLQKKNNQCREYLMAEVETAINLNKKPIVKLLPASGKSLLHIQTKSPAMFLGGSMLKITGLDKDYTITLGENPEYVFADEGDQLDIYLIVPSTLSINSGSSLKFYFYAYDENKKNAIDGDEYHYYMKCNAKISAANDKVVKLSLPNKPTHAAIQLGLPSGRKWATTNVGATSETDYGKYFAWGEVDSKSDYSQGTSSTEGKLLASLNADGIIDVNYNLTASHDAAVQNWGDYWIMPKQKDFEELREKCTWTWTSSGSAKGYKVEKNGKSIFLPAAGFASGSGKSGESMEGYYRTASITLQNNKWVYGILFNSSSNNADYIDGERYKGLPVRPVVANSGDVVIDIDGQLSGKFTVHSNGRKVRFSKGNLQYQASTGLWQFAEKQYDYIGNANKNISPSYSGWIDLYGWGTSGWNSGAKEYMPYSASTDSAAYSPGGVYKNNLTGTYKNADWGVYNKISNGGDKADLWRVLTADEWKYLFESRTNAAKLRSKATVNGVYGYIFLPDNFQCPSNITFVADIKDKTYTSNHFTSEQWDILEFLGAVFFPTTGYRYEGTKLKQEGTNGVYVGCYWTSSVSGTGDDKHQWRAKNFRFGNDMPALVWEGHGIVILVMRCVLSAK